MKTILMFARDTLQGKFEKVKSYMEHEVETNKGKWMKAANKYKQELGLTWENIRMLDKKSLKKVVREWDNQKWKNNLEEKPTLKWYKQGKQSVQYDQCYTNSIG